MRKTKEDTEISRRKLIEAAKRIFREKGYSATKLEDIGKAIGMTRGVVYWHFKNKAQLFQFLVENVMNSIEESFDDLLATDRPLVEKLRSLFLYVQENPDIELLQAIVPKEKIERQSLHYLDEKAKRFMSKTTKVFDKARDSGEIYADTDTQSVLGLLMVFMSGLEHSKHSRLSFQARSINVTAMIDMMFKGISSIQKK
jgi:TetR/AcrR family transcriptional regulator, acrAB operon repressor